MANKFEVGDTGKTVAEDRYEVIGVNGTEIFVVINRAAIAKPIYDVRDLNGIPTLNSVTQDRLIPTRIKSIRNVWLNVYAANKTTVPCVYGYDREKDAKNGVCHIKKPLVIALPVQLEWEK